MVYVFASIYMYYTVGDICPTIIDIRMYNVECRLWVSPRHFPLLTWCNNLVYPKSFTTISPPAFCILPTHTPPTDVATK